MAQLDKPRSDMEVFGDYVCSELSKLPYDLQRNAKKAIKKIIDDAEDEADARKQQQHHYQSFYSANYNPYEFSAPSSVGTSTASVENQISNPASPSTSTAISQATYVLNEFSQFN